MNLKDIGTFVDSLKQAEVRVGGKYQFAVLAQKRALELMRGAPALVDMRTGDLGEVALQEVLAEKIVLVPPVQPEHAPL